LLYSLITSETRIKLLMKFFLNPGTRAYLWGLADEFGESTNSVRVQLNRLSEASLLESEPILVVWANEKPQGFTQNYPASDAS